MAGNGQKKTYLYGPNGEGGWYMGGEWPTGWTVSPVKSEAVDPEPKKNKKKGKKGAPDLTNEEKLSEAQRLEGEGQIKEANAILDSIEEE